MKQEEIEKDFCICKHKPLYSFKEDDLRNIKPKQGCFIRTYEHKCPYCGQKWITIYSCEGESTGWSYIWTGNGWSWSR